LCHCKWSARVAADTHGFAVAPSSFGFRFLSIDNRLRPGQEFAAMPSRLSLRAYSRHSAKPDRANARQEAVMNSHAIPLLLAASTALHFGFAAAQSNNAVAGVTPHEVSSPANASTGNRHVHRAKGSILLHADGLSAPAGSQPSLDVDSAYVGPSDPSDPSTPLICNPAVRRAVDRAWGSSALAAHRPPVETNDKVEFGFAIDMRQSDRSLRIGPMQSSDLTDRRPNELEIPVSQATIATVHTHNTGARSTPSAADVKSEIPAFVRSQSRLFVTIPGTSQFAEIELGKVCETN
jgi:hypothetical protein